jgi:acetyl esterase/lipase
METNLANKNIILTYLSYLGLCMLFCTTTFSYGSQVPHLKGLHEEVAIGEIDGVKLSINLAFPQTRSAQTRPVLIMIHGGGFLKGDKSKNNLRIQKMTQLGFVAASAMYRFAPEHKFPAALDDIKLAIRFLKAHAIKYHINPERIILSGASSGSYLAIMAGVTGNSDAFDDHGLYTEFDSSVHAVAGQSSPISDFRRAKYSEFSLVKRLLEHNSTNHQQRLAALSPITYLDPDDPPMFLSHGDADPIVPVEMSREFVRELAQRGHSFEYHELAGGTHSYSQSVPDKAKAVFKFYRRFIEKWAQ